MALKSRKGKAEDITITISKSTSDNRVVMTKPFSGSLEGKGQQEAGPDGEDESPQQGAGRGHRKQLMVTMAGKKGKRVVSERTERRPGPADIRGPADDGQAKRVESTARGKQPPHTAKRDAAAQDQVKQGQKHTDELQRLPEQGQDLAGPQTSTDLNIPTSKEEQEEYLRWKREREEIDRERVARHKNSKGQWRRAWDMDKTENMFSEKPVPYRDRGPSSKGGRNARRGQAKADSRGNEKQGKDKGAKNVPVMSSKAKGIDRLTGRARRWQPNEDEEKFQMCDTTLEEFLEELDALTDPEAEESKVSPEPLPLSASEEAGGSTAPAAAADPGEDSAAQGEAGASSPRSAEKRVRFSEEPFQSPRCADSEARCVGSLKASKQGPRPSGESAQPDDGSGGAHDQTGGVPTALTAVEHQPSDTECTRTDGSDHSATPRSASPEKACGPSAQPIELAKCSISNTNTELLESGLSVLSLESGETHPTLSSSSDKAREHGKIV